MGVAAGVVGLQADEPEGRVDATLALPGGHALHPQPLGDAVADGGPRVERGERVLEHDLHLGPHPAQLRARRRQEILALVAQRAGVRIQEAQQQAPQGALAAPRLPHEAEHLARPHVEVDVGHGVDPPLGPAQRPAADGERLHQAAGLEQRHLVGHRHVVAHGRRRPPRRRRSPPHPADRHRRGRLGGVTVQEAAHLVARRHLHQRRHLLQAPGEAGFDPRLAPGCEAAPDG